MDEKLVSSKGFECYENVYNIIMCNVVSITSVESSRLSYRSECSGSSEEMFDSCDRMKC